MYEMSFLWNNNVCCGCTGFLHILWAFIAANMREGEGHNRLLISWMQEFPTVRRGGSESQHGLCIFRNGKASNFYQVTVKISLLVVERPVSQQEARTSQTASSLFEGAERWWEYKYLWGSCVCWPGLNFSHTLCFWGRLCGEQVIFSTEITWASITTTAGVWHSSLGTRRIPRSSKQLI